MENENEKENKLEYSYFKKSINERLKIQMVEKGLVNEGQKSQEEESKKEDEENKRESFSFPPIGKSNYINIINIYYRNYI